MLCKTYFFIFTKVLILIIISSEFSSELGAEKKNLQFLNFENILNILFISIIFLFWIVYPDELRQEYFYQKLVFKIFSKNFYLQFLIFLILSLHNAPTLKMLFLFSANLS